MVPRPGRPATIVAGLLAVNTIAFVALPTAGIRMLEVSTAAAAPDDEETSHPAALDRTRQYDVRANDRHWEALVQFVGRYDSETTALVTETSSAGSFRHLSYYVPDHHLYGLGWDRRGFLGYLFHAQDRRTTYSVETLDHATEAMVLAHDVRTVIIPDGMLLERLEDSAVADIERVKVTNGPTVAVVHLSTAGGIVVDNPDQDESADASRSDGFPSAADRAASDGEEATVRFVTAEQAHDQRPDDPAHGITLAP